MNIKITAAADKFIRRMVRFAGTGRASDGFRLLVSPGGCSGLASTFTVEASPVKGDGVFEENGLRLFLPAESRILLEGTTIDFVETPKESGFIFRNAAASSCGCEPKSAQASLVSICTPKAKPSEPLTLMEIVS